MDCIVMKFGGTSVSSVEARKLVIQKIKNAKYKYKNVVVVVSAMGRMGSPYATDTLLSLVDLAHSTNAEKDLLLSCGELISCVIMSNLLSQEGLKAQALSGGLSGIITNNDFGNAETVNLKPERLIDLMEQDIIPVVAGFQGITEMGEITTLGRGGSDTSAALLGQALQARQIEIYTDVDGIMTADPRLCKTAQTIRQLGYSEVFQMADSGAKVIHPRAVEVAKRAGIPLIIKNTFSESEGTNIHDSVYSNEMPADGKLITSIAHRNNRVQFNLLGSEIDDEMFFNDLAKAKVSIDIINIFPDRKVFTIDADKKQVVQSIIEQYKLDANVLEQCSKVTIIGERMTGVPGVMARVIKALKSKNIQIYQTADSLATIACLIKSSDLEMAIQILHKEFNLEA